MQYCNKNPNPNINQEKLNNNNNKFKLEWTDDEIYNLMDETLKILLIGEHDSLLIFISSHGDSDSVILDSNCEEVSLFAMFANFFGDKCALMIDKPKIFIVDACRGSMKSRVKTASTRNLSEMENIEQPQQKKEAKEEKEQKEEKEAQVRGITPNATNMTNAANITSGKLKGTRKSTLKDYFQTEANCRFIYANPDGYAAVDGGAKGGYLIQAVKHVFSNKNHIQQENLDSIVNQIRWKTRKLVGTATMQNVQDVNHMNFNVFFKKK